MYRRVGTRKAVGGTLYPPPPSFKFVRPKRYTHHKKCTPHKLFSSPPQFGIIASPFRIIASSVHIIVCFPPHFL